MGYTHYWTHKRRFTTSEWSSILNDFNKIVELSDLPVDVEIDDKNKVFYLQGTCETFVIYQNRRPLESWQKPSQHGWDFCKTRQDLYDVIVTACLIYLTSLYPKHITASSDGDAIDWKPGLDLALQVYPEARIPLT